MHFGMFTSTHHFLDIFGTHISLKRCLMLYIKQNFPFILSFRGKLRLWGPKKKRSKIVMES